MNYRECQSIDQPRYFSSIFRIAIPIIYLALAASGVYIISTMPSSERERLIEIISPEKNIYNLESNLNRTNYFSGSHNR